MRKLYLSLFLCLAASVLLAAGNPAPARADDDNRVTIIIDAEVDHWLHQLADPLLKEDGLDPKNINFHVVVDDSINAFVTSQTDVFINTGLIRAAKSADQVAGVFAHEFGHIKGRHLIRDEIAQQKLMRPGLIAGVLGVGAMLAGAPQAGAALMVGGPAASISGMLAFSRGQEQDADQIAVTSMRAIHYPVVGLEQFFDKLSKDEILYQSAPPPFLLDHPSPPNRMAFLASAVAEQNKADPKAHIPAAVAGNFARIQAKVFALANPAGRTLRQYLEDTTPVGDYARAIAYAVQARYDDSKQLIDKLEKEWPHDAFLIEFKGELEMDNSHLPQAIADFTQALGLMPDAWLIRYELAQAQIANGNPAAALPNLLQVQVDRPAWNQIYSTLGIAYGQLNELGKSHLNLALAAYYQGDRQDMGMHMDAAEKYAKQEHDQKTLQALADLKPQYTDMKKK